MAALTVDARLIFGDRPKEMTYHRLLTIPSLVELDEAFGAQVSCALSRMP